MDQDVLHLMFHTVHDDSNCKELLRKLCSLWECAEAGDCDTISPTSLIRLTGAFLSYVGNQSRKSSCAEQRKLVGRLIRNVVSCIERVLGDLCRNSPHDAQESDLSKIVTILPTFLDDNCEISGLYEILDRAVHLCLERCLNDALDHSRPAACLCFSTLQILSRVPHVSLDKTCSLLLKILSSGKSQLIPYILTKFIPDLAASRPLQFDSFLRDAFSLIFTFFSVQESGYLREIQTGAYIILSALVEYMHLTIDKDTSPIRTSIFWRVIQHGFVHDDSLTRKRTMYVMRHVLDSCYHLQHTLQTELFLWMPDRKDELMDWWKTIIVILEVLEEKQPHVVKPVLAKFCALLERYEPPLHVHVSWILLLFHRMMTHESRTIAKWALTKFVGCRSVIRFTFQEKETKFICGPFVKTLNCSSMFSREEGNSLGSLVPLARTLEEFLGFCLETFSPTSGLDEFLRRLFAAVCKETWNGVSLLYVSHALSGLQAMPIFDASMLQSSGEMLIDVQRFQEPVIRSAVQCYWVDICLRLVDPSKVSYEELSAFLGVFKREDVFVRGSTQWNRATETIKELAISDADCGECKLSSAQAARFLLDTVKNLIGSEDSHASARQCTRRLARMAVLLSDSGTTDGLLKWEELLRDCISILGTAASRAYLPQQKVHSAMELFLMLCEEATSIAGNGSLREELLDLLCPYVDEISEHVYKSAFKPVKCIADFEASLEYFRFLDLLSTAPDFKRCLYTFLTDGLCQCEQSLLQEDGLGSSATVSTVSNWRFLWWAVQRFPEKKDQAHQIVLATIERGGIGLPLAKPKNWAIQDSVSKARWVTVSASVTELIWNCVRSVPLSGVHCEKVVCEAMDALETSTQESSLHVLRAVAHAVSQLEDANVALPSRFLRLCWQSCIDLRKSNLFRPAVEVFVTLAFRPSFLRSEMRERLSRYADSVQELGDAIPGVFNALVKHLIAVWEKPGNEDLLGDGCEILVKALTYGPVYRKDQRSVFDAEAFVTSQGELLSVNQLLKNEHRADAEVRARCIVFLTQLEAASVLRRNFAAKLVRSLLDHNRQVLSTRKRYFGNSTTHRAKNRVWQAILCLQYLLDEQASKDLLEDIYAELVEESQQPSVRCFLEWAAVRILLRYPSTRTTLVPAMDKASKERTGSICSFLAILVQLGACLDADGDLESHLSTFMPEILPWSMGQHFNARIYAQVALHLASRWSRSRGLSAVLETYRPLFCCLRTGAETGNWSKNVERLLDDFYFSAFHAVKHYTLQTIFSDLPRLTGLTDRELVPMAVFKDVLSGYKSTLALPLWNPDDSLSIARPSFWIDASQDGAEVTAGTEDDFQKKTTPWKQALSSVDPLDDFRLSERRSQQDGLIVVASLIDRIPNLGGLCRTCEVFGASEFVLDSLKHVEDRQFQNLSVSAERWISTSEVKPHQLKDYLPKKRAEGYTLVGVEQTAGSTALHDYKFPKKTLLLLGNEKEGLPVELIQLLDVCVEIPQQGVVRSLNVHVSGAILVWEYTKQHLAS